MSVPGKKATKSSTTSMGSDEDIKLYCQPCDRDGQRFPAHGYCTNCAEHLCETCFTVHRRHTLSRHHSLLDKVNMPQTMSSVTPSHSDNLIKPCPKHNIEMIKFYCHDHKALLCSVCVTLEHTPTSCKVNYIPDVSGQVINSKEYRDTLKAVDDMTKEASKILQYMRKMNDASNKSLKDALTDIKKFRTQINQRLDELEKQVKEAAKSILEENSRNMMSVEKECGDLSKSLKTSCDAITHFNTSKQANDLFMELKQAGQMIKGYESSVAKLTAFDVKVYNFEPNEEISNMLSKEKSMGTLKGRSLSLKLKPKQISYMDKIYVETSKDGLSCWISGMTLHTPNLLIITDYGNKAVKMVDISQKSVLDKQNLDSNPWDISSVTQDEFAVTVPEKQTIQFLSVSRNKLKKKQTIKVNGRCHGISCHEDKMVVSFIYPAKVQILLINGTVLQTIQDDNIFKYPYNVTKSDNYIYVSDENKNTISKLNWQGKVKGNYDCSSMPQGLILSDDETVFVCYDDNTIREISEDFTKEQTVVKGIQAPYTVCWSAETCTLYISGFNSDREKDQFIKIFKF